MPKAISRYIKSKISNKILAVSSDLTPMEQAELDGIIFGDTTNPEYIESLWAHPAYICKRLKSGRWAITRILPDEDAKNLVYFSAILTHNDWFNVLQSDCDLIIFDSQLWRFHGNDQTVIIDPQPLIFPPDEQTKELALSLVQAVEAFYNSGKTIIVSEQEFPTRVFRWLFMLLPEGIRQNFSYGVRVLSDGVNLDIASISDKASHSGIKGKTVLWYQGRPTANTPYSNRLANAWKNNEQLPLEFVKDYDDFEHLKTNVPNKQKNSSIVSQSPKNIQSKIELNNISFNQPPALPYKKSNFSNYAKWLIALILVIVFFAAGAFWAISVKKDAEIRKLSEKAIAFLDDNNLTVLFKSNPDFEPIISQYQVLNSEIEQELKKTKNDNLAKLKTRLVNWYENAKSALLQKSELDNLFLQAASVRLPQQENSYPEPQVIQQAQEILAKLNEIQNNFKLPNPEYIQQTQQIILTYKKFLSSLDDIIPNSQTKIDKLKAEVENTKTDYFSDSLKQRMDAIISELDNIQSSVQLLNAAQSPIAEHLNQAVLALSNLAEIKKQVQIKQENILSKRDTALQNIQEADKILSNIQNIEKQLQIAEVEKAQQLIAASAQLYPDNPELENLLNKAAKIKEDITQKLNQKPIDNTPKENIVEDINHTIMI